MFFGVYGLRYCRNAEVCMIIFILAPFAAISLNCNQLCRPERDSTNLYIFLQQLARAKPWSSDIEITDITERHRSFTVLPSGTTQLRGRGCEMSAGKSGCILYSSRLRRQRGGNVAKCGADAAWIFANVTHWCIAKRTAKYLHSASSVCAV